MERSTLETDFVTIDDKVIGVNLGFDFVAEHEFGIKHLQQDFGFQVENELGFEARKNTIVPEGFIYCENLKEDSAVLLYNSSLEHSLDGELSFLLNRSLVAAWDESSFGVRVKSEHKFILKNLYDAFIDRNGVITLSGSNNPFSNSGLTLLDYRLIPGNVKEEVRENDRVFREEQALFRRLEEESGVYGLLKKSGKNFYALGVRKLSEEGEPLWWLNPVGQEIYKA